MTKLQIEHASVSDVGGREINEDSIGKLVDENNAFFVLADGLGGHGSGEVASATVVTQALESYASGDADLDACFIQAQDALMNEQLTRNDQSGMKTTMVALKIVDDKAQWAHVGDSRLYWFIDHKVKTHTLDHSIPQMLVSTGEIRQKDVRGHEDRNRLFRVMGVEWQSPKYEVAEEITLGGNDRFLLCSDGFWEYITEKVMQKLLRTSKTAEEWLSKMCDEAEKNSKGKKRDNFSAIVVFVRES